jgi:hypothetical protein
VVVEDSQTLRHVHFTESFSLRLKGLWISECPGLEEVDLSGLDALQQLTLMGCKELRLLQGLRRLCQLRAVTKNRKPRKPRDKCLYFPRLEVVELSGCSQTAVSHCIASLQAGCLSRVAGAVNVGGSYVQLQGTTSSQLLLAGWRPSGMQHLCSTCSLPSSRMFPAWCVSV